MCVSITPPEWYRNVVFGGPGPWTSCFSRKELLVERLFNFLEDNCSSVKRGVILFFCFSVTMASRFERVDEEYIEEFKVKGDNENTKNSTKW